MSTLVCITGNLRGSEKAWQSLIDEVLDPFSADLALCVGEHPDNETNMLCKRAQYYWPVREYDDWGEYYDSISDKDWRVILKNATRDTLWGGIKYHGKQLQGSGGIVLAFKHILRQRIIDHDLVTKYDRFIITRADHYYMLHYPLEKLDPNYIWIPEGADNYTRHAYRQGICDRHAIVSRDDVLDFLAILEFTFDHLDRVVKFVSNFTTPEMYLKFFMQQIDLFHKCKRFERGFFLVKAEDDQTRWAGNNFYIKDLGLYGKYKDEFLLARRAWQRSARQRKRTA